MRGRCCAVECGRREGRGLCGGRERLGEGAHRPIIRWNHSQKKMPLKSSIEKGIDEPLYSRWYSGNCFHRSNSASHSASLRGHRLPCGRQSVIDRPDLVSRVMPPTTTMQNTEPLLTSSHHPTARSTVWAAGAATADATASATLPAPTPGIDNVERPRRASESSGWLDDVLALSSRGSALVDALAPASSRGSAGSALARATRAAWSSIGKERRAAAQEEERRAARALGDLRKVPSVPEKKLQYARLTNTSLVVCFYLFLLVQVGTLSSSPNPSFGLSVLFVFLPRFTPAQRKELYSGTPHTARFRRTSPPPLAMALPPPSNTCSHLTPTPHPH